MHALHLEGWARFRADVGKDPVPLVPEQLVGLRVGYRRIEQGNVVDHVAVRREDIQPAVVIEILEGRTESQEQKRGIAHARAESGFGEGAVPVVPVQRVGFQGEIGHVDIRRPVPVVVSDIHPHARPGDAVLAIGHARQQSHVGKRAVAIVPVQEIRRQVVGHEDIRPSVAIVVASHHPEALAVRIGDARLRGDVRKRAVAVVPVQQVGRSLVDIGSAVGLDAVPGAAPVGLEVEFDVRTHVEVQVPVPVVVQERRAGRERGVTGYRQIRTDGHVQECPVPFVPVEDVRPVVRDEQVVVSVVVVVRDGQAHPVTVRIAHAGLASHVREGSVTVVAIKDAGQGPVGHEARDGRAVEQVDVEVAVPVVVDEPAAGRYRFEEVVPARFAVGVPERDPGRRRDVRELHDRPGRIRTRIGLAGLAGLAAGRGKEKEGEKYRCPFQRRFLMSTTVMATRASTPRLTPATRNPDTGSLTSGTSKAALAFCSPRTENSTST